MHEFKRFIQQQLDARGWKQADLVRKSGLSKQHVSNMLRDTREHLGQMPDEKTIRALADGFQMPAEVVRTAASRALAGYSDEGQPLHVDIHQVPLDTLLNEIRRRFEEIGEHHGPGTEEEQEPRTQAGGPEHSSEARGDRRGTGASMMSVKVARLNRSEPSSDLFSAEHHTSPQDTGRMPPPDQLREDQILAARTTDDTSGMYPEDTDE